METKLSKAKAEQAQLLRQLQETRDSLEKLKVDEEAARTAVERAEEDFTGSLKEGLTAVVSVKLPQPQFEEQTKARLSDLRQLGSTPVESKSPYRLIPYRLRLTGNYEQVVGFLGSLESGPRLAAISSFSFRRRDAGGPAVVLELDVELLGKK